VALHLDTSVLISAIVEAGVVLDRLEARLRDGERIACCTLVLYEWARGPRRPVQLALQRRLLAGAPVVAFGEEEALVAADLYRRMARPRRREIDLAIAACALTHRARLWTLNPKDFSDIPGLALAQT
jgi:predicted nucleic acid-binding protein